MQAAIAVLGQAVQLDQQGQFQRAVDKYAEGVQLLMIPLKNERDPNKRANIKKRLVSYLERAEVLKAQIKKNNKVCCLRL